MKRIKSACLMQTIHFQLNDRISHSMAVEAVKQEYAHYKKQLERNGTNYQILDETVQPDGSIIIHIKKQNNKQNCDEYIN